MSRLALTVLTRRMLLLTLWCMLTVTMFLTLRWVMVRLLVSGMAQFLVAKLVRHRGLQGCRRDRLYGVRVLANLCGSDEEVSISMLPKSWVMCFDVGA